MTTPMSIVGRLDAVPQKPERPRKYIGASSIGNPCHAYLSLSLRGFPTRQPDQRLFRIFRDGHRIEDQVLADLRAAGYHVMDVDPITGKQFAYHLIGGHVSGHADGLIEEDDGKLAYLEIKSMNDAKFKTFIKQSVRLSHPMYYAQVQAMMGMAKVGAAFVVAYNKNDGAYHVERVEFDEFFYLGLVEKATQVVAGQSNRIASDESDWRCKSCFQFTACWNNSVDLGEHKSCSHCTHSVATNAGGWHCKKRDTEALDTCADFEQWVPMEKAT